MAELSAYLRAVLSFGLVGVLIAFIASFSSCGIMSNDVIAILFGIVIIIAGGQKLLILVLLFFRLHQQFAALFAPLLNILTMDQRPASLSLFLFAYLCFYC